VIINKFKIYGMTCASCVEKVTEKIQSIPYVKSVKVSLDDSMAVLESINGVKLNEIKEVFATSPKYTVFDSEESSFVNNTNAQQNESKLKTYKPLIIIFSYVLLVSLSFQIFRKSFQIHLFMNHLMAGFFIGLSFFKFIDLKSFAESFSGYDPVAKRIQFYGKIYPFIELVLGLMLIAGVGLRIANFTTVIVLSLTTFGVIKRLQSKSKIQCACLGAGFNLPLSYVTVFENMAMVLMALYEII